MFPTANPKYALKPPEWKACAAWANAYGDTGPARLLGGPGGARSMAAAGEKSEQEGKGADSRSAESRALSSRLSGSRASKVTQNAEQLVCSPPTT